MKGIPFFGLTLFLAGILFTQEGLAQDYTRGRLPDGAIARLGKGRINKDHRAVVWSQDGTQLAVASSIGIWLYDAGTGAEVHLLTGHIDEVKSMTFSPDSKTLASGSSDKTVRLWDVATGQEKYTFTGHTKAVYSVLFTSAGKTLASGSRGVIRLWDVSSGDEKRVIQLWDTLWLQTQKILADHRKFLSMSFSPDGTTLATGMPGRYGCGMWTTAG